MRNPAGRDFLDFLLHRYSAKFLVLSSAFEFVTPPIFFSLREPLKSSASSLLGTLWRSTATNPPGGNRLTLLSSHTLQSYNQWRSHTSLLPFYFYIRAFGFIFFWYDFTRLIYIQYHILFIIRVLAKMKICSDKFSDLKCSSFSNRKAASNVE